MDIFAFVELITSNIAWYDCFDSDSDSEKFITIYKWFEEFKASNLVSEEDIINHFLVSNIDDSDE